MTLAWTVSGMDTCIDELMRELQGRPDSSTFSFSGVSDLSSLPDAYPKSFSSTSRGERIALLLKAAYIRDAGHACAKGVYLRGMARSQHLRAVYRAGRELHIEGSRT